jgi:glycosyltransferase involved in cell wall biosynthesis
MAVTSRMDVTVGLGTGSEPFSRPVRKIVLVAEEDTFVLAHCRGLLSVLAELGREIVIVTRSSGRLGELEAPGVSVIDCDCRASFQNPAQDARAGWRLARILEPENADVMHFIGVGSAVLGSFALKFVSAQHVVIHLPELGPLGSTPGAGSWLYRPIATKLIASLVGKPESFLLVENPDDLTDLRTQGVEPGARFAVLGGFGVDTDTYLVLPPSQSDMPVAAFVGEMLTGSGLDVLMRAFDRVWARGVRLKLELVGQRDVEGPDALPADQLTLWGLRPGVHVPGPGADVREVWRRAEICVLPATSRQGTPRALLEAAACGRALIVTKGAGGNSFVRDGVEGLVVASGDAAALGEALERLARDASLRLRLGEAARLRVLQGYTDAQVKQTLRATYVSLLGKAADASTH